MINDITFVIAVRKGSKRIKNKNIRYFAGSSLLKIKLQQIVRVFKKPKILFSSDCKKSIQLAKKYTQNINIRPKKYCSDNIPMKKVYKYLASLVNTKYICYLHVTSPLLKDKTLKEIIKSKNKIEKNRRDNYDSIATVANFQEYLWYKGKALNYNNNNHPRSQTLPIYQAINFAVNIISKKQMFQQSRIIGKKFFPKVLSFPENLDVDEKWQFIVAGQIYKKFKKKIFSK